MQIRTLTCAVVGLALGVMVAAPFASAAETDLSWIAQTPGLSGGVQERDGDGIRTVYAVAGDLDEALDFVTSGLEERGWRLSRNAASVTVGVSSVHGIKALKGSARLTIAVMGTAGARSLALRLRDGSRVRASGASGASATGFVVREPGNGSVSVDAGGGIVVQDEGTGDRVRIGAGGIDIVERRGAGDHVRVSHGGIDASDGRSGAIVISGMDTTRTIRCEEGADEVVVNGTDHKVTLRGACASLTVTGTDNEVRVRASIERIVVSGVDNRVGWDPELNAHAPRTVRSGVGNRVYRLSE